MANTLIILNKSNKDPTIASKTTLGIGMTSVNAVKRPLEKNNNKTIKQHYKTMRERNLTSPENAYSSCLVLKNPDEPSVNFIYEERQL